MDKNEVMEQVKALIEAPMCCAPLRAAAEVYQAAVGTDMEEKLAKAFCEELGQDVNLIEESIAFFGSEKAANMMGADKAAEMVKAFKGAQANGEKYCLCPACQAGGKLYDYFKGLGL